MWQEILATDSRISHYRMMAQQEKDLRPLYIKRRHQLLQGTLLNPEVQELPADDESGCGGPVRNKRYLSLRVKLLKRQFSLPSDVLSLKSLTLQQSGGHGSAPMEQDNPAAGRLLPREVRSASAGTDYFNPDLLNENIPRKGSGRASFNGVHHIFDQHSGSITRIMFGHSLSSEEREPFLVCSSLDGTLSLADLGSRTHAFLVGHSRGVVDMDLSESDDLLVSSSLDGSVILWDVKNKRQLR